MTARVMPARVVCVLGKYGMKNWHARCRGQYPRRCAFDEKHPTHNGAHMAKARHNRTVHA